MAEYSIISYIYIYEYNINICQVYLMYEGNREHNIKIYTDFRIKRINAYFIF